MDTTSIASAETMHDTSFLTENKSDVNYEDLNELLSVYKDSISLSEDMPTVEFKKYPFNETNLHRHLR